MLNLEINSFFHTFTCISKKIRFLLGVGQQNKLVAQLERLEGVGDLFPLVVKAFEMHDDRFVMIA